DRLFILTETWLNSSFLDTELFCQEFLVYRKDRHIGVAKELGGGVLVAVRNKIVSSPVSFPFKLSLELICVKLSFETRFVYIINVYIPPKSSNVVYSELSMAINYIMDLYCSNSNILLVGDFKLPHIDWILSEDESCQEGSLTSSQTELAFLDKIITADLQQISCIKNSKNRILDLVFSSDAISTLVLESSSGITNIDHYHPPLKIFLDLSNHVIENSNAFDCSYTPDFRKANFQLLCEDLNNSGINTISTYTNIDEAVITFYSILNNCINNTIPLKISKQSNFNHAWYTKELRTLRNRRNRAWKTYLKSLSLTDHNNYIEIFEDFKILSNTLYTNYINEMASSLKGDPKSFWKFVNTKKNSDGYPANFIHENLLLQTPSDICNAFANNFRNSFVDAPFDVDEDYLKCLHTYAQTSRNNIPVQHDTVLDLLSSLKDDYSSGPDAIPPILLKKCRNTLVQPLLFLFELSIKSGKFPCLWKKSFLTPIFKKGDKTLITNYRPISKLSCIPKVFEQVVCESIAFFSKNLICEQQHGFVRKRSTVTNLLTFLHKCSNALEQGREVDCVYTRVGQKTIFWIFKKAHRSKGAK
ncbi:uncharacterized protein LOC129906323, partial [Episyrphus balteatus]|uniref:uncharacterized protein LOC129906323 n=1 Tax=Episyrphus balteatus TaxID=286459 RepID=UPI0024852F23